MNGRARVGARPFGVSRGAGRVASGTGDAVLSALLTSMVARAGLARWLGWLAVYAPLEGLYEELARMCHAHGRDDLLPPERRRDVR